jgi:hypothetical protein
LTIQQANVTGDANVFITAQCRLKSSSTKEQKNPDPSCGQWGKPWPKDAYMSGLSLIYSVVYSSFNLLHFLNLYRGSG